MNEFSLDHKAHPYAEFSVCTGIAVTNNSNMKSKNDQPRVALSFFYSPYGTGNGTSKIKYTETGEEIQLIPRQLIDLQDHIGKEFSYISSTFGMWATLCFVDLDRRFTSEIVDLNESDKLPITSSTKKKILWVLEGTALYNDTTYMISKLGVVNNKTVEIEITSPTAKVCILTEV